MSTVRVEPLGISIDVLESETLIEAAWRQGYYWPTICHGNGQCSACHVVVERGGEHLEPPGPDEERTIRLTLDGPTREAVRLACQLRVSGDAVVRKDGVIFVGEGSPRLG